MKKSNDDNPKISEGTMLALASAGAYLFAFYYERGYASVFKIPTSFISVSLDSVLIFGAILISAILFILPFLNLLLMLSINKGKPALQRALFPAIILLALLLIQIYAYGFSNWNNWFWVLLCIAVLLFLQFIFPLITQRGRTYSEKLEAQEKTEKQFTDSFVLVQNKFGNNALLLIVTFLIGMQVASTLGTAEAVRQNEFLVTNTSPELVVLRIYGENLVCVPFNRVTGEIEQNFSVIKNTGEVGLILKLEKLGQLHVPMTTPPKTATSTPLPASTPTPTIATP